MSARVGEQGIFTEFARWGEIHQWRDTIHRSRPPNMGSMEVSLEEAIEVTSHTVETRDCAKAGSPKGPSAGWSEEDEDGRSSMGKLGLGRFGESRNGFGPFVGSG